MDISPSAPPPLVVQDRPRRSRRRRYILLAVLLLVAGLLVWRHPWNSGGRNPAAGGNLAARGKPDPNAPTTVTAGRVSVADIPVTLSELGTVTPLVTVTVRSQISGYLQRIDFSEGQEVRHGDLLAEVDPRPYQAALEQFQGNLMRDQALLHDAQLDLARYQHLSRLDSISRQNVDTQAAAVAQYQGAIRTDQGNIDAQQLNIDYTRIRAPSDGRVGLRQVDAGNYVTPGDTNGVVVLTQLKPISVIFTIPQTELTPVLLRLRQTMAAGSGLPVTALATDNTTTVGTGTVETIDNQIDTTTGTVKLRAIFPNDAETLFPNQFVNAVLLVDTIRQALVVPSEAVQRGTPGTYVYLIGADGKVSLRIIAIGAAANGLTQVTSGLALNDQVVLDGTSRLRAGSPVTVAGAAPAADTHPHRHRGSSADDGTPPANGAH